MSGEGSLFFCLVAGAKLGEKGFQDRAAFRFEDAARDGDLVVELRHVQEV